MAKKVNIKKIIVVAMCAYQFVEVIVSDVMYYSLGKVYFTSLAVLAFICLLNPLLIVLIIPFHLIWKFVLFTHKKVEGIRNRKERSYWLRLDGFSFEKELAEVLRSNGYTKVKVTRKTRDGGIDLSFRKDGLNYIAQAKNYTNFVDIGPVRSLWGAKDDFNADMVVLIASTGVTYDAKEFIKRRNGKYLLWTLTDIIKMSRNVDK